MDRILIRDLALTCIIGTNEDERTSRQTVVLNIGLECDLSKACASDDLADTVNYKALKNDIVAMVDASAFFLIERLAGEVARLCLLRPQVEVVTVAVDKPAALTRARSVAVEIRRERVRQAP